MIRSSIGFHTFTVFKQLSKETADAILVSFKQYQLDTGEIDIFPTDKSKKSIRIVYTSGDRGIKWLLRFCNITDDFKIYIIEATINPETLVGIKDQAAANHKYMDAIETMFNLEARKISPLLLGFSSYELNRLDYCINFHLRELGIDCDPMLMMKLMKQSNIPTHYTEHELYDDTSHRMMSDPASHYLKSKSVVVNCYYKYMELLKRSQDKQDRGLSPIAPRILEDAYDLIRFEIQCKYPKVYTISREFSKTLHEALVHPFCEDQTDSLSVTAQNSLTHMLSEDTCM